MAVPLQFVTLSPGLSGNARVSRAQDHQEQFPTARRAEPEGPRLKALRAARRLGSAGAVMLLLSGVLGMPGIAVAQTPLPLSGTWRLSCPTRKGQARQITLQIEQSGSKLSGSFSSRRRSGSLNGTVQGGDVSLQMGANARSITLTGTTDGNSMTVRDRRGVSCSGSRR